MLEASTIGGLNRDQVMRRALWVSTFFNLVGAIAMALPASFFGYLAGMPESAPAVYRFALAWFALLFGGSYAWLASQPRIDRPLVAVATIGKAGFFALMFILWLAGEAAGRGVLAASGDMVLASIYAWWLSGEQA